MAAHVWQIIDLKQANNLLTDTDLSLKKNIRIPKAKCRIHHLASQNSSIAWNENKNGTKSTAEINNTATDLFAAIDMDMENVRQSMKNALKNSSVAADGSK